MTDATQPPDVRAHDGQLAASDRRNARAKAAFLLHALAADGVPPAERASAFLGLADDIDRVAAYLSPSELAEAGHTIARAFERAQGAWSVTLSPDAAGIDLPDDLLDGTSIRRLVVAPGSSGFVLASTAVPSDAEIEIVTEYTHDSATPSTLSITDAAGTVLASAALPAGYERTSTVRCHTGRAADTTIEIRIDHAGGGSLYWYQSIVSRAVAPEAEQSISVELHESVREQVRVHEDRQTTGSVFAPVTKEPLTLGDIDRLMTLHNRFRGERLFVMGNGPSLNRTPLELLDNEFVFGVNRISLLFERVSWRPTFFTAFDVRVVPDNKDEFAALDVPYKFFSARYKRLLGEQDNHYWYHTKGHYEGFDSCFDPDVVYSGFGGGGTIGVMAIELGYFLGFREIYLIGTDVSYSVPETVKQSGDDLFGDGVKMQLESTKDDDSNHFDPRYFGQGKKWHSPNVRDMKIGFARAAAAMERRGAKLRNATVGGDLDQVERIDFESLF